MDILVVMSPYRIQRRSTQWQLLWQEFVFAAVQVVFATA